MTDKKTIWSSLAIWVSVWVVTMGFSKIMNIHGIDEINHSSVAIAYFSLISGLLVYFLRDIFLPIFRKFDTKSLFIFAIIILSGVAICFLSGHYLESPARLIGQNPGVLFIRMDIHYFLSRIFNILFQQLMIVWLILILDKYQLSLGTIIAIFLVFFGLSHLLLLGLIGVQFTLYFSSFAALSAIIFPYFILRRKNGMIITFSIHWIFYVLSALFFWLIPLWR